MKYGMQDINAKKYGNQNITKVMYGTELIWDETPTEECPELIDNGTFNTNVDGVIPLAGNPTITWIDDNGDGRCEIIAPTSSDEWAQYPVIVEIGKTYLAHGEYHGGTANFNILRLETINGTFIHDFYVNGNAYPDIEFEATDTDLRFSIRHKVGSTATVIDNLSVKCTETNKMPNPGFNDGTYSPWYPQTIDGNDTCVLSIVDLEGENNV